MKLLGRILIIAGLALLAIGRKLEKPEPPAAKLVILPRRYYRPPPSRWEVIRAGFEIAFSSVAFATVGA